MTDERQGIALQILGLLASQETDFPGLTRGEIRHRLGLPADVEITARIRELRRRVGYGNFDVRVERESRKVMRYWMPLGERIRAREFLRWSKTA